MKAYLNAKLFLFKNILKKEKTVIFDKSIKKSQKLLKIYQKKNIYGSSIFIKRKKN